MGLKRGLWRSTGIGRTIDTVKNIVDEGFYLSSNLFLYYYLRQ